MGYYNKRLVKHKRISILVGAIALIGIVWVAKGLLSKPQDELGDNSYKPMVSYESSIYGWDGDLEQLPSTASYIGTIAKSYNTLEETIDKDDPSLTSNVYPVGSKVYKLEEGGLAIELENGIVKLSLLP